MKNQKSKLIFIAPLPPPYGGMSAITKSFFEAGLAEEIDLIHLNTSKNSLTEKFGKITLHDILLAIKNYIKLFIICLTNISNRNAFLIGTSDSGIIRDMGYIIILKLFKKNIFLNLHGTRTYLRSNELYKFFTRQSIRLSKKILSPTIVDMKGLSTLNLGGDKNVLFYNSTYTNNQFVELSLKQNEEVFTIVGSGRLSKSKGSFDLINVVCELLRENYKIKLFWIGRGAFQEDDRNADEIIHLMEKEGFNNSFYILRDFPDKEKIKVLTNSDIFILPTYSDNLPIAILEAMSLGLPVISTNIGAIPEVIQKNVNGFLFNAGDVKELKRLIINSIENSDLLIKISCNNKETFVSKYSSKQRIIELKEFLLN